MYTGETCNGLYKMLELRVKTFIKSKEDQDLFNSQMENDNYGVVNFYNVSEETYQMRREAIDHES